MLELGLVFLGVSLFFGLALLPSRKVKEPVDLLGDILDSIDAAIELDLKEIEKADELYFSELTGNFFIYNSVENSLVIDCFTAPYNKTEFETLIVDNELIKIGNLC